MLIQTHTDMERVQGSYPVILLLFFQVASMASLLDSREVYLHFGQPGRVQCPLVASNTVTVKEISSAYWYKVFPEGDVSLVSNHEGSVSSEYGGKYSITTDFSLGVDDTTVGDNGMYECRVIRNQQILRRRVNVTIFISPSEPAPRVDECSVMDDRHGYCPILLPAEQMRYNVTCRVTDAQPEVDLHLLRVFANSSSEVVHQVVRRVWRNVTDTRGNLFSTTLFFKGEFHGNTTLLCIATGIAMGDRNGSLVEVRVFKRPPKKVHLTVTITAGPLLGVTATDANSKKTENHLKMEPLSITVICVLSVALLVLAVILIKKALTSRRRAIRTADYQRGEMKRSLSAQSCPEPAKVPLK